LFLLANRGTESVLTKSSQRLTSAGSSGYASFFEGDHGDGGITGNAGLKNGFFVFNLERANSRVSRQVKGSSGNLRHQRKIQFIIAG
jgi:hypothetical protein